MTAKDLNRVAAILKEQREAHDTAHNNAIDHVAVALAAEFVDSAQRNARERFLKACGVES